MENTNTIPLSEEPKELEKDDLIKEINTLNDLVIRQNKVIVDQGANVDLAITLLEKQVSNVEMLQNHAYDHDRFLLELCKNWFINLFFTKRILKQLKKHLYYTLLK